MAFAKLFLSGRDKGLPASDEEAISAVCHTGGFVQFTDNSD